MVKIYGNQIASCPSCGVAIGDAHPYKWCIACGEQLPNEIAAEIPSLVSKQAMQVAAQQTATHQKAERQTTTASEVELLQQLVSINQKQLYWVRLIGIAVLFLWLAKLFAIWK